MRVKIEDKELVNKYCMKYEDWAEDKTKANQVYVEDED
jgi:hypothetical protein